MGLGVAVGVVTAVSTPSAALAPGLAPSPLGLPCAAYPGGDTVCSGEVRSFDGAPLDVDVTVPAAGTGTSHPLMVMFHGFGNNKHEWESTNDGGDGGDKYHWNSHWFADHGYYVLTYTARGFTDQGPSRADEPNTPAGTDPSCHPPTVPAGSAAGSDCAPSGTIRVKNKDVEIRDSQYLAALTAAAFPDINPNRVAVSGGSYGGGESWLQAADPSWTFAHTVDPTLPVLQLQVAVPKYGWTDLAYSLVPNGHPGYLPGDPAYSSSQGRPDAHGVGNPVGAAKASYIAGLYTLGTTTGSFEEGTAPTPVKPAPCTAPETFTSWLARVNAGPPYDVAGVVDPVVAQIRQDFSDCHSAFYQPGWQAQRAAGHETAVFAIQGWTDDLFEAVESFRMFKYLKTLDPRWPVAVGVADVGHSRAQNKPATWHRLNNQANQFLFAQIAGSHQQQTTVFSEPTLCPNDPDSTKDLTAAQQLTATTPEGLANGTLDVVGPAGSTVNPLSAGDPDGLASDAVVAGRLPSQVSPAPACRVSTTPSFPGRYTAISGPLTRSRTYVGLGSVQVPYTLAGATTATLNARVWVQPAAGGPALLVTRGTYRIDTPAYDGLSGILRLPLYGNHWPFAVGDRIRLDLTQDDAPTYRPDTQPCTITFGPPKL
ncbi:MAG: acetylxylan esterase, partial [Actinomycetota bacterium]|nr:acetylxylan esterase [Actinomycetota bacterium]